MARRNACLKNIENFHSLRLHTAECELSAAIEEVKLKAHKDLCKKRKSIDFLHGIKNTKKLKKITTNTIDYILFGNLLYSFP